MKSLTQYIKEGNEESWKENDLLVQHIGSQPNFYKIVSISASGKSAKVQKIEKQYSDDGEGVSPNPNRTIGTEKSVRIINGRIKIDGYDCNKITAKYSTHDFDD